MKEGRDPFLLALNETNPLVLGVSVAFRAFSWSGARVKSSFLYSLARHSFLSVVRENGITNRMSVPAP